MKNLLNIINNNKNKQILSRISTKYATNYVNYLLNVNKNNTSYVYNIFKRDFCNKNSYYIFDKPSYEHKYDENNSQVNKYNRNRIKSMDYDKVNELLENLNLEPKVSESEIKVKYCPLCTKPHNDDPTNFYTLNISKLKNLYHCFRCASKGHVIQLIKIMNRGSSSGYLNGGSSSSNSSNENDDSYDKRISNNNENNNTNKNYNNSYNNSESNNTYSNHDDLIFSSNSDNNAPLNSNIVQKKNTDFFDYSQNTNQIYKSNNYNNNNSNNNSSNYQNSRDSTPVVNSMYYGTNMSGKSAQPISANINLIYEMFKRIQGVEYSQNKLILDYVINERKLKLETILKFKVGFSYEKFAVSEGKYYNLPCVTYPLLIPNSSMQVIKPNPKDINEDVYELFECDKYYLTKVKVRAIGKELKRFQRVEPTGALFQGLFGIFTIEDNNNKIEKDANGYEYEQVVITEGEFDAMAVYQETGIPSLSLPNGCSNLPNELIPFLNKFKKIYLWTDADQAGKIASDNFAKKLGVKKTLIVNSRRNDPNGPKDANDCLKEGKDIKYYLRDAKLLAGENVIRFDDIRSEILQFLSQYDHYSGYKSTSFEFFNDKLKGLRPGEFTILTGETGCGKTTFLAQLSLDFLQQRIPTLWGSFEIKNDKLASMFLMQLAKKDLRQTSIAEIEYYSDQFEKLPLYFLKFHGSQGIDEIMNSLNFAVNNYDIQVVVLDNLQFMTGNFTKMNKFDYQDEIIHKLRLFATEKNVHIVLVIHPKKTDEALRVNSIFGTGKASQEADNIFIIQNYKGLRVIEIAKNRFNGSTGKAVIAFDKGSCRFFEVKEDDLILYSQDKITLDELVIKHRKENPAENSSDIIEELKHLEKITGDKIFANENDEKIIYKISKDDKVNEKISINKAELDENIIMKSNSINEPSFNNNLKEKITEKDLTVQSVIKEKINDENDVVNSNIIEEIHLNADIENQSEDKSQTSELIEEKLLESNKNVKEANDVKCNNKEDEVLFKKSENKEEEKTIKIKLDNEKTLQTKDNKTSSNDFSNHDNKKKIRNVNPDSFILKSDKSSSLIYESEAQKMKEQENKVMISLLSKELETDIKVTTTLDQINNFIDQENEENMIIEEREKSLELKKEEVLELEEDYENDDKLKPFFKDDEFFHNKIIPNNQTIESFHNNESKSNCEQFNQSYSSFNKSKDYKDKKGGSNYNFKEKRIFEGVLDDY